MRAHRWMTFTTRLMIAGVSIVALVSAIWSAVAQPFREQWHATAAIRRDGGDVDTQLGSQWRRFILGVELARDTVTVSFDEGAAPCESELVKAVSSLPRLERIELVGTKITPSGVKEIRRVNGCSIRYERVLKAHKGPIHDVAFSPDGCVFVTAGADDLVKVWDFRSCQALTTLESHATEVTAVEFSKSGHELLTADLAGGLRRWNTIEWSHLGNGEAPNQIIQVRALADGRVLTRGLLAKVYCWNSALSSCNVFAPNATAFAVSSADGTTAIGSFSCRVFLRPNAGSGEALVHDSPKTPRDHLEVSWLEFSPDGRKLVAICSRARLGHRLLMIDVRDRAVEFTLGESWRWTRQRATFSPDGRYIVAVGPGIGVWEVSSGKKINELATDQALNCVAFSPDGDFLVAGSYYGSVFLCNTGALTRGN